jgi:serine/threonine protein kinase
MIGDLEPKISNFERRKSLRPSRLDLNLRNESWSDLYVPREILGDDNRSCDSKTDIFSFGMMMYTVLTGSRHPFPDCNHHFLVAECIMKGDRPSFPLDTPPQLVELAKSCWDADPAKRPEMREIVEVFADPELISSIPGLSSSRYVEYQERIKIDWIDADRGNQSFAAIPAASRRLIIGIDLGTTHSSVGGFTRRGPELIRTCRRTSIPSVVAFREGAWVIGEVAAVSARRYPTTTVYDIKRMLGCSFDMPGIQAAMRSWPFRVSRGDAGELLIDTRE